MAGIEPVLLFLHALPWWQAFLLFLAENLAILLACIWIGNWLVRRFLERPVAAPARSNRLELVLAATTVLLNTLVTFAGWFLWREGVIVLRTGLGWRAWLDAIALLLIMDFGMYILHRIAHLPLLYPLLHRTHHLFEDPRPITLFALNPLECISFGVLWLVVLCLYPASWVGVAVYLTLNVAFGLVGHLGVEPFPQRWNDHPILRYISTSTFHAQHHQAETHNFGFYTVIWDRLFQTLSPHYTTWFGQPLRAVRPWAGTALSLQDEIRRLARIAASHVVQGEYEELLRKGMIDRATAGVVRETMEMQEPQAVTPDDSEIYLYEADDGSSCDVDVSLLQDGAHSQLVVQCFAEIDPRAQKVVRFYVTGVDA